MEERRSSKTFISPQLDNDHMKRIFLSLSLFLATSSLFFLFLLIHPSAVGISYDWSTPASSVTFSQFPITSSWHDGPIMPNNSLFLNLYYSVAFTVGIKTLWATILLLVIGVAIAGYACYTLIRELTGSYWPAIIGGLVYMASADLFLKLYYGWLDYLIAYALTPFVLFVFLRFLAHRKITTACVGGLIFTVVASGQPQFFFIVAILLVSYAVWQDRQWQRILLAAAIFLSVYFLMSYWWLGTYLGDISGTLVAAQNNLSAAYQGFQNNAILNIFQLPFVVWSIKEFLTTLHLPLLGYVWMVASIVTFAIPLLVYTAHRENGKRNEWSIFLVHFLILFIGLTLVKGTAHPFSTLGDLFYRLPVLSGLFRNINHFYYLIPFSSSVLVGLSISFGISRVSNVRTRNRRRALVIIYVLVLLMPFTLNVYRSRLHTYRLDGRSYEGLLTRYQKSEHDGRLLWLPFGLYVKYNDDQDKETGVTYTGVNPLANAVSPHQYIDRAEVGSTASLLTQLIAYGYCDRIPSCPERVIGLQSAGDVVHLKRDFRSAVPMLNDVQYYRDARWYSSTATSGWLEGLSDAKKTYDNGALEVYSLTAKTVSPHVYVPTSIDAVLAQRGALFDGVTLDRDSSAAFLVNPDDTSGATKVMVPLDFTEDSIDKVSHNLSQAHASFVVPENGNYSLNYFQRRKTSTSPLTIFSVKKVDNETRSIELEKNERPSSNKGSFVRTEEVYLTRGKYTITFSNSVNVNNSVFNHSFEYGIWRGTVFNCTPDPTVLSVVKDGNRPHVLRMDNHEKDACQTAVVGGLQPNQKYLFSYDIKNSYGSQPIVCLSTEEDGYCRGPNAHFTTGTWQHREFIYEQGDSERAIITMRVSASEQISKNEIDNLELRQVSVPETLAFVKENDTISGMAKLIEYRKISDTKYRVVLRGASGTVPLVLGEQFDPRWHAYIMRTESALLEFDGQPTQPAQSSGTVKNDNLPTGHFWETRGVRPVAQHQEVNGGSNLWKIPLSESGKDVEVVLEYTPQRSLIVGQLLALLTAIVIVFSAVVVRLRRHSGGSASL